MYTNDHKFIGMLLIIIGQCYLKVSLALDNNFINLIVRCTV